VRSAAGKLAAACAAALALTGHAPALARAALPLKPCARSNEYACGTLAVPLDPAGAVSGTIALNLRRHRAPVGEARSAVIALAGGPGQSAVPITEEFTELLGPILGARDLIVFDQRGTGSSGPLSCQAVRPSAHFHTVGMVVAACGAELGPDRSFYTSLDTVADIEAIRIAGGYEKLVLYGTSYGTKVAELYAQLHPEHVEALVLDSVVPPNGPDPLNRATFAAIPRVVRSICARHACAHITREPVADLARVLTRMRHVAVEGRYVDPRGAAHQLRISSQELLEILVAGDLAPVLRGEFVTAVRAAAERDYAPLARLIARTFTPSGAPESIDLPLYFATTCEEELFPWNRSGSPGARLQAARAAIGSLPASATRPFNKLDMLDLGDFRACADWPYSSPAPVLAAGSLPNVPTLILSGADDLRTPTANAREVAAQIPDAHLLVVPDTGHSVLTSEPTPCAHNALLAQFAARPIKPCQAIATPAVLHPPPLPPTRLAGISPTSGYLGRPGRTLHAVTLTFADLSRQLGLQLLELVASGSLSGLSVLRSGGLRAGWMRYAEGTLVLHGYSYVPGVTISGEIGPEEANLQIGGSAAAQGTLRLGRHHALVGALEGVDVHLGSAGLGAAAGGLASGFGSTLVGMPHNARVRGERLMSEFARSLARLPAPAGG
jgi:pimeloyl-ACP methyl ester carboxylesterase